MTANFVLIIFIAIRMIQFVSELVLSLRNRSYYEDPKNLNQACQHLDIAADEIEKALDYSRDKFRFSISHESIDLLLLFIFLIMGGFGWVEQQSMIILGDKAHPVWTGLIFFGLLGAASFILSIPWDYYFTFVIEEKHGFNRQTIKTFITDKVKGILVSIVLVGILLGTILWIMNFMGTFWWMYAWAFMVVFSLLTLWIYPSFLAPLFNRFTPLENQELKEQIQAMAQKTGFQADEIYQMDASVRSSHGNAYFTGVGNKKRIVLFDTLLDMLSEKEILAVMAHELGHFKLKHIFWSLIRTFLITGLLLYILSLLLPIDIFYRAFSMNGVTSYGALFVFSLWYGPIDFLFKPLRNTFSRKNEFAADYFAAKVVGNTTDLADALKKLRQKSHAIPISYPLFSTFYYSHPPILERIQTLRSLKVDS